MNAERWFTIGQFIVTVVAGAILFSLRHAFRAGTYATSLDTRLRAVEARMDRAGEKMSEFATTVQGIPERMRQTYATREQYDEIRDEIFYLRDKVDRRDPNNTDSPWPNNRRRKV